MEDTIVGKACKIDKDNVDTDAILPARYLLMFDPEELGKHALEEMMPKFAEKVKAGNSILVVGKNFGCGSMRFHAAAALFGAGVKAIVAPAGSIARTFYRNAVNSGKMLPIEVDASVIASISDGDELEIRLQEGEVQENKINNLTKAESYSFKPFSGVVKDIIEAGGLSAYSRKMKK